MLADGACCFVSPRMHDGRTASENENEIVTTRPGESKAWVRTNSGRKPRSIHICDRRCLHEDESSYERQADRSYFRLLPGVGRFLVPFPVQCIYSLRYDDAQGGAEQEASPIYGYQLESGGRKGEGEWDPASDQGSHEPGVLL
jgi:hypothetical protein